MINQNGSNDLLKFLGTSKIPIMVMFGEKKVNLVKYDLLI